MTELEEPHQLQRSPGLRAPRAGQAQARPLFLTPEKEGRLLQPLSGTPAKAMWGHSGKLRDTCHTLSSLSSHNHLGGCVHFAGEEIEAQGLGSCSVLRVGKQWGQDQTPGPHLHGPPWPRVRSPCVAHLLPAVVSDLGYLGVIREVGAVVPLHRREARLT